jgi:hypothetical protein|tara:strand:+ start:867 stop:1181 length:315 start_codon:yes stop_codon:yes gene_type:complete
MPTYSFRNKLTGEEFDRFMGIQHAEDYLKENPNIERWLKHAPMLVPSVGDRTKLDGGWKDMLGRVAEQNPYSKLADDYGKKDAKSVKLREVVKEVKRKVGPISE